MTQYNVIVIGAGHAGCEAALAAARMGCRTLIITMKRDTIGLMPCNPAIGGPAKGQIVGEIDALGGEMGKAADATMMQMKVLNRSRGPAVQCLRAQNDKYAYKDYMRTILESQNNLTILESIVDQLLVENKQVKGVKTKEGQDIISQTIVITTGTFLRGKIHVGLNNHSAGRMGEPSSEGLTQSLMELGLKIGRLKTGTTPRLDSNSIDYSQMIVQPGDPEFLRFSFQTPYHEKFRDQVDCYLTGTTEATHAMIRSGLDQSPLYQKVIKGSGPRYCPSIEDKIIRFSDKPTHQIFIEPESRTTNEIYAQGLNTSLSEETQARFITTIPGLQNVKILKYGYAVEYDVVFPNQLFPTLECRNTPHLFLAGQINGTSGYEEAAGQGIIAGINAALKVKEEPPLILKREDAYIGTLIDDLITKPHYEPYRMLTSRSEYRLLLRQDNALFRLYHHGYRVGLINNNQKKEIETRIREVSDLKKSWQTTSTPIALVKKHNMKQKFPIKTFLKRPESSIDDLLETGIITPQQKESAHQAIIEIKYKGYIQKQESDIQKIKKIENNPLPENIDFTQISGLKHESQEKLNQHRPKTIYDAQNIAGVNPADIIVLLAFLERNRRSLSSQ